MKRPAVYCLLGVALLLSACSGTEQVNVLKSPCVGIEGSPCGPKRPMNGNYNQQSANPAPVAMVA